MKRLGRVDLISHNGCLLVRGDFVPQEGSEVVDRTGNELGRISRVFGPVASPYVSIKPSREFRRAMVGAIGQEVYVADVASAHQGGGARFRGVQRARGVKRKG